MLDNSTFEAMMASLAAVSLFVWWPMALVALAGMAARRIFG